MESSECSSLGILPALATLTDSSSSTAKASPMRREECSAAPRWQLPLAAVPMTHKTRVPTTHGTRPVCMTSSGGEEEATTRSPSRW